MIGGIIFLPEASQHFVEMYDRKGCSFVAVRDQLRGDVAHLLAIANLRLKVAERLSEFAMTQMITFEFVVPTMLAAVLGIVLSIGAVYLTERCLGPVDQMEANHFVADSRGIAGANPDGRLSHVHLLP